MPRYITSCNNIDWSKVCGLNGDITHTFCNTVSDKITNTLVARQPTLLLLGMKLKACVW